MLTEKSVVSERGRTYYWLGKGQDPAGVNLFFLHGLTANHHLFDRQVEAFPQAGTIIVWDAPAHGRSRPYRDFSYPHLAEEAKAILDQEGLDRVVLVGQSMGGFVAQSFVRLYPQLVQGLVFIGSCPFEREYYSPSDLWWLERIEIMSQLFPDRLLRKTMAHMCGCTEYGRRHMEEMLADYEKRELCHLMYLGFAGFIPELGPMDIPCPLLLLVGDKDRIGKVLAYNKRWQEKQGWPLRLIPQAAHNANEDQPKIVNGLIHEFIGRLDRNSRQGDVYK